MIKILLTGASGQLGREIQKLSGRYAVELIALSREQCDISDEAALEKNFLQYQPQFLINAAAYTAVDLAETHEVEAMSINAYAVEALAKVCKKYDCILIHFSTDYVFDGEKTTPYLEDDVTNPLSVYGRSKLLGEQLLQKTWDKHIILRVSWIFARHGKNFVQTILRLASAQPTLRIVNDQKGCPTYAGHIADVVFKIMQSAAIPFGIYHYCDQPATTWFEFSKEILESAGIQCEVTPIRTEDFLTSAARPKNSVLDCSKIENTFGVQRFDWQAGLKILNLSRKRERGSPCHSEHREESCF